MTTPLPYRSLVLGAAGRDFHDALVFFRGNPAFRLVAFTAAQIPFIDGRAFPGEWLGYERDVPIHLESELPGLVRSLGIEFVFLAYSDLEHAEVMHKASRVQSLGAAFVLLGPKQTQLRSSRPVVAITACRTGAGKSPLTQALAAHLARRGERPAVLRHPMPYGDLRAQRVQRFASVADLDRHRCTIEEREEYEPYVEMGVPVWAGVDYREILGRAEAEASVILWDGGNNDYPFLVPDLSLVVVDPLRPGHERSYYPGETNVRAADVVVASKARSASPEALAALRRSVAELNPRAPWIEADLVVEVDHPERIEGRRALVVEDGPTTTHGGMAHGAATVAARRHGARELIDPRPHAVGTIARAFEAYPHLTHALPALGYSEAQLADLRETIARCSPDVIVDGSPARLDRLFPLDIPLARVRYRLEPLSGPDPFALVEQAIAAARAGREEAPRG